MATCTVTGTIQTPGGTPVVGASVVFYGRLPNGVSPVTFNNTEVTATTIAGGAFTVALVQGALVRVRCADIGMEELTIAIPLSASADFQTLVDQATVTPDPQNPFATEAELEAETAARVAGDTTNASAIADETTRAETAEDTLATSITNEATARASGDSTNATAIANEVTRATTAEGANTTAIASEMTRAEAAEAALAAILAWLHVTGDKTIEPSPPGSTFLFNNTIVRAYQFNLNGRIIVGSDAVDEASFSDPSDGTKYAAVDISVARKTTLRDVDGNMTQLGIGGLDFNGLSTITPYQWGPNPAFHGVVIGQPFQGSIAIFGAGNGTAYLWNPVDNVGGTWSADNFANGNRLFTVDPAGNTQVATIKIGATGAVAISESPAGVMQATAGDLSTPVTMRFKSITATAAAPVTSTPGIEGEIRFDGSHVYRYTGGAWFSAPLTFTAV